ncbi:MAG TPA: hypothetical protein VFU15_14125, partial [Bacteroidia bacterium]|nr:hypothetical protein [Bacteroidia bacterium]
LYTPIGLLYEGLWYLFVYEIYRINYNVSNNEMFFENSERLPVCEFRWSAAGIFKQLPDLAAARELMPQMHLWSGNFPGWKLKTCGF